MGDSCLTQSVCPVTWPRQMLDDLPRNHYRAILADPPWAFSAWDGDRLPTRTHLQHYKTMKADAIKNIPVMQCAADDCVLFCWVTWPLFLEGLETIREWGFTYKTCAFCWVKADTRQIDMFRNDLDVQVGMGYWTRANSEVCLLATCGQPKRLDAGVRQAIVEPRREHSRKPDCVHKRIERLVDGPYLELFSRQKRDGWDSWGNEVDKFERKKDVGG